LLVAAALIKAALACYLRWGMHLGRVDVPTATSHHDSMLFALACAALLARFWERPCRATLRTCLFTLPLLLAGMLANNRRLAWVELFAVLALFAAVSPRTRLKKLLATALVAAVPLIAAYALVGWKSQSTIFKPVQTLRSVIDSKSDRSSETRDIENYDLLVTLRRNALVPLGFGHPYVEAVKFDDISSVFKQYRYIPHNSVLGFWAFGGLFGFFGLWLLPTVGAFLAARAYRFAKAPADRAAALTCLAMALIYLLQCWGDMGAIAWHGSILLGAALAAAGKLALHTGAWPDRATSSEAP
jgi:hypothetical protein